MMNIWTLPVLLLGTILVPWLVGAGFTKKQEYLQAWVSGQFVLWGIFELVAVPVIRAEKTLGMLAAVYGMIVAILCLIGLGCLVRKHKRNNRMPEEPLQKLRLGFRKLDYPMLTAVFFILLVLQMVLSMLLTYADGDDAFYVAMSTSTSAFDKQMYLKLPYTGGGTGLSPRYSLAPFPMWISLLSVISGAKPVVMAHTLLPPILILFSYACMALVGKELFSGQDEAGKKCRIFLIFISILVLFGDVSTMSPANFLLARSRQGKAALAAIVIPMLWVLMLKLLKKLGEGQGKPAGIGDYVLLSSVMLTGCLCSTLGTVICMVFLGMMGAVCLFVYKRWQQLPYLIWGCLPGIAYAILYVMVK